MDMVSTLALAGAKDSLAGSRPDNPLRWQRRPVGAHGITDSQRSPAKRFMSDDSTVLARSSQTGLAAAAREASGKPAALVVIAGELSGTLFDLDAEEISLGRSDATDIRLEFVGVSRRHLVLVGEGGGFSARDLGSKNGSFVNDRRITEATPLRKGDVLRVGPVSFKYIPQGDPERLAYDKLKDRTQIDRFTGCYNKSHFIERAELEVAASRRKSTPLSLLVLDIDHFKAINDSHGHDAGDSVLRELAGLIRKHGVRTNDLCARYGGEEFVILLPGTALASALEIGERLRGLVEKHDFAYQGRPLPVTVSIGAAARDTDITGGAELFRRADAALYEAKRAGRNRVHTSNG
jgi:diguanylate cyclase (GGDEF)-like protein